MRRKFLFVIKCIFAAMLFIGIGRFCHKQTRGFSQLKIASDSPIACQEETDSWPSQQRSELNTILDQPFSFLSSGGQCYAFLSEDGKTVIKFFKQHHIRMWNRLNSFPLPHIFRPVIQKLLEKKTHQSPQFFDSCKIAYGDFKERSGLLYLHLHKTRCFKKKLKIIDNLRITHLIDLDSTDFALQRYAELSHRKFRALIKENNLDAAKQCIDSVIGLTLERYRKGIVDRDANMRTNIGFLGTHAIEIDLGSFTKQKISDSYEEELLQRTQKFHSWLSKQNPMLALYLSEQIKNACN